MPRATAILNEPAEFSLVQGGPFFQGLLRLGLVRPSMELLARRIIVMAAVAWGPLLVLTMLSGHAFGGEGVPFISDVGAHVRFLVCVPMLIAAEVIVHKRITLTVRQFLDRGIIAPEDQPVFERIIASTMRLRNSVIVEVVLLAVAIGPGYFLGQRYLASEIATWFAVPGDGHTHLTAAGYWYVFVSLSIFRFLGLRWYFRLFLWYRFLWLVSRRLPLQLNALHPDRAGGLGFLSNSVYALQPLLVAHTAALSGILGGKIWHEGATLPQFKLEILAWVFILMLMALVPLFFFMVQLADAKRAGLREYGIVGSRYVAEFRRKWIEGQAAKDEALIGTADIQSLADLANSFEVVRDMGIVPFNRSTVMRLAIMTALPLVPLSLTMIPLEQLIDRALAVFI